MKLVIDPEDYREVIARCAAEAPKEACGLLSGRGNQVLRVFHAVNSAETPLTRYFIAPEEMFGILDRIWDTEEELVAIYHSHPASEAYPSEKDIEMAHYPDSFYVIVSLAGPEPVARAFNIRDGKVQEAEIVLVPSGRYPGKTAG